MNYEVEPNQIKINLPSKNAGKFRYKKRQNIGEYGKGFATATEMFDNDSYLEWQVGYDVIVTELDKKPTKLTDIIFVGANGKTKHPYELSELLFFALKRGLIKDEKILETIKIINECHCFFEDDSKIKLDSFRDFPYNNLKFKRGDITLPNFFYETKQGINIEVSIQKQQYASGVQPMVYISIPVRLFENADEMLGNYSQNVDQAIFLITDDNVDFLLEIFKIFGMCSQRHKFDVLEILTKLIS